MPAVIVITAYGDPANRLVGKLHGVYSYLIKPFTPHEVEAHRQKCPEQRCRMSHLVHADGAALMLLVVSIVSFLLLQQTVRLPENIIDQPTAALPDRRSNRPLAGALSASRRRRRSTAGRRSVCVWRAISGARWAICAAPSPTGKRPTPDAAVLHDRAQAYLELQRWADAADALEHLLKLLPIDSPDRPWAQFQLGLIRAAYNPAQALDLLRAAQPTYGDAGHDAAGAARSRDRSDSRSALRWRAESLVVCRTGVFAVQRPAGAGICWAGARYAGQGRLAADRRRR